MTNDKIIICKTEDGQISVDVSQIWRIINQSVRTF
jgi:hypothetical protein